MLRRRFCSYTVFYIAGIAAGYFMLERSRYLGAAGFAASMVVLAMCIEPSDSVHLQKNRLMAKFRQGLVLSLLFGMLVFSVKYAEFGLAENIYNSSNNSTESAVSDSNGSQSDSTKASQPCGSEAGISVRGRVLSCTPDDDKLKLTIKSEGPLHPLILVTAANFDPNINSALLPGAVIEAAGKLRDIAPADNPGCFDYRRYLRGKGISLSIKTNGFSIVDEGNSALIRHRRYLFKAREDFIGRFSEETAGFIRGVIFGDKRDMDEDLIDEFNSNFTGHILAVSGLHMGFLFGLLKLLTGRRRTGPVSFLIITVLFIYGEMTMWSAATVRACLVASLSILSLHLRRRFDLLTSVCLAAVCILFHQPYQLFDAGFQLSFLAMAGISIVTKALTSVAGEVIAVAAAVQLGTLPVAAYAFNCYEPLALFINMPMIMLASVLVPMCILMLMAQLAVGIVPSVGIKAAELLSRAVIGANHLLASGSGPPIRSAGFGASITVVYYLLLFGLCSEFTRVMLLRMKRRELLKLGALILLPVLMLSSSLFDSLADDEVVFVAVGQGDCTHVRAAGRNLLIDGGGVVGYGNENNSDDGFNVGEKILMPYLLHSGAERVDAALVTHLHADHYKGITELSEVLPVGAIGIPIDYRGDPEKIAGSYDPARIFYIRPDTRTDITDDVFIDVLWPLTVSDKPLAADDPNEHNTVYMIHYGKIKIMVTGDLLEEDELEMVRHYEGTDSLKCDVLKIAHHGSKSSSSEAFLDAAAPSVAVIQVGRNNLYGHPHAQTLERLESRGIQVFRTDMSGAVGIDIHGDSFAVDMYRHH